MLPPSANSPNRPPDWRWERARWLHENGKLVRLNREDALVLAIRQYHVARKKANTDVKLARLEADMPGLFHAHEVFENPDNRAIRWGLEARLLSRQPFADVAARAGLSTDVVRWYECAFFNVIDKLDASDYIASVVIGEAIHRGVNPRDYNLLWKLYGYAGGPVVLDAVISQRAPDGPVRQWLEDDTVGMLALKANQAARTVPVAFNHAVVFDAYLRLQQAAKAVPLAAGGFEAQVRSILAAVTGVITGGGETPPDAGLYGRYDASAGELRASEMLALSAGIGQPPAGVEAIALPTAEQAKAAAQGGS